MSLVLAALMAITFVACVDVPLPDLATEPESWDLERPSSPEHQATIDPEPEDCSEYKMCCPGAVDCSTGDDVVRVCNEEGSDYDDVECLSGCCAMALACGPVRGVTITPHEIVDDAAPAFSVRINSRDTSVQYDTTVCVAPWDTNSADDFATCNFVGPGTNPIAELSMPSDDSRYVACIDGSKESVSVYSCCFDTRGQPIVDSEHVFDAGYYHREMAFPTDVGSCRHTKIDDVRINGGDKPVAYLAAGSAIGVEIFADKLYNQCNCPYLSCGTQIHVGWRYVSGPDLAAGAAQHIKCIKDSSTGSHGTTVGKKTVDFTAPTPTAVGRHVYALRLMHTAKSDCSNNAPIPDTDPVNTIGYFVIDVL